MIDVLSQPCPNCQAPVGEACTAADNYSRHPVKRVHGARIQAVHDAEFIGFNESAPDMSEEFQRDADADAAAEDIETAYIPSSLQTPEIRAALVAAFRAGAEWGSRPF